MYPLLPSAELTLLNQALYFMKMEDLKNACHKLSLPAKGKKLELINRIMTFVNTGEIIHSPKIPSISCSKNHPSPLLSPTSLMLYGSYKNDLRARTFFKNLIGDHFHFTAYGIDWLNERWHSGNPPTYQEFANYWMEETARRKNTKVSPKEEWALINFIQEKRITDPTISQHQLMSLWKQKQHEQTMIALTLIKKILKTENLMSS